MWVLRDVVGTGAAGLRSLSKRRWPTTEAALDGSGSPPSLIIGNHDITRFISVAHGDADRDPWGETTGGAARRSRRVRAPAARARPRADAAGDPDDLLRRRGRPRRRQRPGQPPRHARPSSPTCKPQLLGQHRAPSPSLRRCLARPAARRASARWSSATPRTPSRVNADAVVLVSTATEPSTIALPSTAPPGAFVDALSGAAFTLGPASEPGRHASAVAPGFGAAGSMPACYRLKDSGATTRLHGRDAAGFGPAATTACSPRAR